MWVKKGLDQAVDRLSGGTEPLVDPSVEAVNAQAELRGQKSKRRK